MADATKVRILLNQNERDSFIDGYTDGDPLTCVYEGEKPFLPYREDLTVTLEFIYDAHQHVRADANPWYEGRSLCKGDIVEINDRAYAFESLGYDEVSISNSRVEVVV